MSHYIERRCERHGDWSDDIDCPSEACPACIQAGLFKTRSDLLEEIERLRSTLAVTQSDMAASADILSKCVALLGIEHFAEVPDEIERLQAGLRQCLSHWLLDDAPSELGGNIEKLKRLCHWDAAIDLARRRA